MKLKVIGLDSNRFGYVSITCLLPDQKEQVDTMKEMLKNLDKDSAAMVQPFILPMQGMMEAMNSGSEKMLRLPMEWDEFIKLDLRLGDSIDLQITRSDKK